MLMRVLAVGPMWRGSNAGGLFRAMSRQGCIMDIVDEFYYISLKTKTKSTKILERIIRKLQFDEFNNAIIESINIFNPNIVFVYKGAFVFPETLFFAKDRGCKLVLFYPDVSMFSHGGYIPKCIPLYDIIFTTKTFGLNDIKVKYNLNNTYFIPHGFDPEIHRALKLNTEDKESFDCDVSFIGTWSPKKEKYLNYLVENCKNIKISIWGSQWEKAKSPNLVQSIKKQTVIGDLYAIAIQCSKINLGILSEQVVGASSGDLITSRTFHIPGANGFMLHEKNIESVIYFKEEIEAGFFSSPEEMVEKVNFYLTNETARFEVQRAGYERAQKDHSLDSRAKYILELFK